MSLAESAIVIGNGILIAGGHRCGIAAADLVGGLIGAAPKLKLQLVHVSQNLLVELLHHGGVAGESRRIKLLHLLFKVGNFFLSSGVALRQGAQLVELALSLADFGFGVAVACSDVGVVRLLHAVVGVGTGIDFPVGAGASAAVADHAACEVSLPIAEIAAALVVAALITATALIATGLIAALALAALPLALLAALTLTTLTGLVAASLLLTALTLLITLASLSGLIALALLIPLSLLPLTALTRLVSLALLRAVLTVFAAPAGCPDPVDHSRSGRLGVRR